MVPGRRPSISLFIATTLVAALVVGTATSSEPILGGPCEGCELVFEGLPDKLSAQARIAPEAEPGEPLILEGTVRTPTGQPASGVIVYAYQTDRGGLYPSANTRHGRLRAWTRTAADGSYRFDTIRPGAYPEQHIPQHVHMHVIEPGRGTYYIDDVHFDDDPLLTPAIRRNLLSGRGGAGLVVPTKDSSGVWRVRRDIILGENIPGYEGAKHPS